MDKKTFRDISPPNQSLHGIPSQFHWADDLISQLSLHLRSRDGLASHTVRNYLTDLLPFWRFLDLNGLHDLSMVDKGTIRRYLHWLLTEATPGSNLRREHLQGTTKLKPQRVGYATSSVVRKLSALRTLFRILRKQRIITDDPTARISQTKLSKKLPRFLDEREILGLLGAPNQNTGMGLRDCAILELLYGAGLRVSELVGLNLDDLNQQRRDILVTGKGNHQRLALLGKPGLTAVNQYIRYSRPKLLGKRNTYALFLNHHGGRLSQRSIQVMVKHYGIQIGLQATVHPHTLRHTYATHLLNGGADIRIVQELLGHASPTTTQIYTHISHSAVRHNYMSAHPRATKSVKKYDIKETTEILKNDEATELGLINPEDGNLK